MEIDEVQQSLLNQVQSYIGAKACLRYNYSRVGREIAFLNEDIIALRNFEFVLCGKGDFDCDELECIKCKINSLK